MLRSDIEMMSVRVLYFAGLRDSIGLSEESLPLPPTVRTVGELLAHLAERHQAYEDSRACVRVARNEQFANDDERLMNGDVIALIPPVAGG
jgi:molybdopterin synthase sulfur carrier subunit